MFKKCFVIVYVLCCGVFAAHHAEHFLEEPCGKIERFCSDKVIFMPEGDRDASVYYRSRSMWVSNKRSCSKLCFLSSGGADSMKIAHLFVASIFEKNNEKFPEELSPLLRDIKNFLLSKEKRFLLFLQESYTLSDTQGALCAFVTAVEVSCQGGAYAFDGVQHPFFASWARFASVQDISSSDQTIFHCGFDGRYGPGCVWISHENGRSVLCYRSELGPAWVCYRYDLTQNDDKWPGNWSASLDRIKAFARSGKQNFWDYSCEERVHVVSVVKAVLAGHSGDMDHDLSWFTWSPQSESDEALRLKVGHIVLKGSATNNVYDKGSVWAQSVFGNVVVRYRSHVLFQWRSTLAPLGIHSFLYEGDCANWLDVLENFIEKDNTPPGGQETIV